MYKLYYYPGNANLAPHMLLEELGVPYELVLVDRTKDAHHSAEYLKLNPMHNPARNRPHLGAFLKRMVERPAIKRASEQEGLGDPLF